MNRTQKEALANLIVFAVMFFFGLLFLIVRLVFKIHPYAVFFYLAILAAVFVLSGIYVFTKQSPREVITDERDKLIKLKAAFASFMSVWVMLGVMLLVLRIILGIAGSIGIWLLALIIFFISIAALAVYSSAILILYLFGKDNA